MVKERHYRIWQTAWKDPELQIMHPVRAIDWDSKIYWVTTSVAGYHFNHAILLEYIGQMDKNGNMIFEGDLLEFDRTVTGKDKQGGHYSTREKAVAKVIYLEEMSMFCLQYLDGYINRYPLVGTYTIIGNIYQHPELFK